MFFNKILSGNCRSFTCILLILISFSSCRPSASTSEEALQVRGVISPNGMVVSAHPEASRIGAEVLKRGGNAFDAAVAVQFALAVAYPRAGNIGGGGFAVYRLQDGTTGSLDFREKAPGASTPDMYLDANREVIPKLSLEGALASGVPGTVAGMFALHGKLGSLPMAELLQPSIDLATRGVELLPMEASTLNRYQQDFAAHNSPDFYFLRERPWEAGDTLYHPDLARTLIRIRDQGEAGFYTGETASLLVAQMQRSGGIMTAADLTAYTAQWRSPVEGYYKGYKIISMGPPSSGGIALLQLLQSSEFFDLGTTGFHHPQTLHYMTELQRRVYADRATYLGDPDFFRVPQQMLLDRQYLQARAATIQQDWKTPSEEVKEGKVEVIESIETTHFSLVDAQGNAVAITTTLNSNFGSKVMVKGAGFFLNNEMDDFSVSPGVPNQFGLVGGEANAIAAHKRMLSAMTPTIVERDGSLLMVLGTPGGSTIINTVYQVILNVLEFGMTLQEAVNAKRLHHQWLPDRVLVEEGALPEQTSQKLRQMGHVLEEVSAIGRVDAVLVLPDGQLEGATDPRGEGQAVGY
jgi:gamma-glutamyltranspeptidase / glutathione hydrolase